MNDFKILKELIHQEATLELAEQYGRKTVVLREEKNTDTDRDYSVSVVGLPKEVLVIRADRFEAPSKIFQNTKSECKRADFIIVANDGRKKVVLYVEMKSSKKEMKEVRNQLKGAKCLFSYCKEVGREFWEEKDFLKDYEERFIYLIGHASLQKKTIRMERKAGIHDRPDQPMIISSPSNRLEFNHLAGKC